MKPRRDKMSAMFKTRLLILLVVAGLASAGCQEQSVTVSNSNNKGDDPPPAEQEDPGESDDPSPTTPSEPGGIDDDGHGPDDDMELLEVGVLNGSWRVAVSTTDEPMVYFDIFQDKGETTGSGDYWMGFVLGPDFDGSAGELSDVEIDGDKIEIAWNPTVDDEEMYWVELVQQDEDTFVGKFNATKRLADPQDKEDMKDILDVTMARRVFDEDDERDPFEDDVPPGYVEPRPGGAEGDE